MTSQDDAAESTPQEEGHEAADAMTTESAMIDIGHILQCPRQVPEGAIQTLSPGSVQQQKSQSDPSETHKANKKLEEM